jgi:hypothetical protein
METTNMQRGENRPLDGVSGLKSLGVKDLNFKMVFIASSVNTGDSRFGLTQSLMSADDLENQEQNVDKMFTR